MTLIRVGSRVRLKPARVIEGLVTKREIIDEGVTYFVHDEVTDHEIPISGDQLDVLSDPVDDAAPEAPAADAEAKTDVASSKKSTA